MPTDAELKHQLEQISLELETAAGAARRAATLVANPGRAWVDMQQLFTRFEEATHRMGEFRRQVDAMVRSANLDERARIAQASRQPPH